MTECVCRICGNKFQGKSKAYRYCSAKCRRVGEREASTKYHRKAFTKPKAKKEKSKSNLDHDIDMAKKQGVSYGKYKASEYKVTVEIPKEGFKSRNQRKNEFFAAVQKFEKGEADD